MLDFGKYCDWRFYWTYNIGWFFFKLIVLSWYLKDCQKKLKPSISKFMPFIHENFCAIRCLQLHILLELKGFSLVKDDQIWCNLIFTFLPIMTSCDIGLHLKIPPPPNNLRWILVFIFIFLQYDLVNTIVGWFFTFMKNL